MKHDGLLPGDTKRRSSKCLNNLIEQTIGVLCWNSGAIASPWLTSSSLVLWKPRIFLQRGFFLRRS
jgi:hypothetical protein